MCWINTTTNMFPFLLLFFFSVSPFGILGLVFCCIFSFWKRRWIVRLPLDSSVFRLVASVTVEHPTQEAVRQHCSCKLSFIIMSGPNWRGCCLDNSQLTMWLLPLWRRVAYIFFFIFFYCVCEPSTRPSFLLPSFYFTIHSSHIPSPPPPPPSKVISVDDKYGVLTTKFFFLLMFSSLACDFIFSLVFDKKKKGDPSDGKKAANRERGGRGCSTPFHDFRNLDGLAAGSWQHQPITVSSTAHTSVACTVYCKALCAVETAAVFR